VTEGGALPVIAAARGEILRQLKRAGELRVDDLAAAIGMTPSGMRQQLRSLASDGYVTYREQRGATGRPKHFYRLTPAADALFPRRYGDLVSDLLQVATEDDPEFVERMFARRGARRLEHARAQLVGSLEQQVRALAEVLDADGYLAEVEALEDGTGWRIIERNCAIFDIAQSYGHACSSELDFLRAALPDATVERVRHMVAGAAQCTYEVRPLR
jgi:DeoR family suf operon transcriptional repressor